jgi:hypothetical protein
MAEPEKNETIVCVSGTLLFDQEKVPVVAETGKELLIELNKPAKLGNALTVGTWLNNSWATPVDMLLVKKPNQATHQVESQSNVTKEEVKTHLTSQGMPDQVTNLLADLLTAEVWITDLYIRRWKDKVDNQDVDKQAFKFGISVKFTEEGLTLFEGIKLLDVGLGISNAPKDYKFPVNKILPKVETVDVKQLEVGNSGTPAA